MTLSIILLTLTMWFVGSYYFGSMVGRCLKELGQGDGD